MTSSATPPLYTVRIGDDGPACDAWADETVLAALEQGGVDWPASCRNGTCRTCIAQLAEGAVQHGIPWPGLLPEEKAAGWALPCVAYPLGDLRLHPPGTGGG